MPQVLQNVLSTYMYGVTKCNTGGTEHAQFIHWRVLLRAASAAVGYTAHVLRPKFNVRLFYMIKHTIHSYHHKIYLLIIISHN